MPRVIPVKGVPSLARKAIAAFGSELRLGLVHRLRESPAVTSELMAEFGIIDRSMLIKNLIALEELGVLVGEPAPKARHRKKVSWSAEPVRVEELTFALGEYLGVSHL